MRIQFLSRRNHFRLLCEELTKYDIDCEIIDNAKSRNFFAYPSSDYITSINSDLVVSHNPYHGLNGAKQAKRKGRVKNIAFRLKADHWTEQKSSEASIKNKLGYLLKKTQYEGSIDEVDYVIAISEYMKNIAIENGMQKPLYIMYNGVDTKRFCERQPDPNYKSEVLCVLNFNVPEKIKLFERTLEEYNEKRSNYNLTVLGDGVYLNRVKKYVKEKKLTKKIIFKGYVKDVEFYYSNCDILLHPSRLESFGMSLLEAGASGKPSVAFNIGAIPEIVLDKKTGYITETVEELIDKVDTLMEDEQKRFKIGKEAKKRILGKFTWKESSKSFLNFLNTEGLWEG